MKKGEPFNISLVWPEIRIPVGILDDRSVSFCAKVTYGLLMKYAGANGYCSVYQAKIARDLGVSRDLMRKVIRMLKDEKYIMSKRQGYGKPAIYYFLWRKEFRTSTGGVNRININPEIHKNILQYYQKMEERMGGKGGQEKRKEGSEPEL